MVPPGLSEAQLAKVPRIQTPKYFRERKSYFRIGPGALQGPLPEPSQPGYPLALKISAEGSGRGTEKD